MPLLTSGCKARHLSNSARIQFQKYTSLDASSSLNQMALGVFSGSRAILPQHEFGANVAAFSSAGAASNFWRVCQGRGVE